MTNLLIHHNGAWHIAYLGLFSDFDRDAGSRLAPFPAFYDAQTKGLICLWGEENISSELVEPTQSEMHEYEERQRRMLVYGPENSKPVNKPPAKSTKPIWADPLEAKTVDGFPWDPKKFGLMPNKLDMAAMRQLNSAQLGISDKQIKLYLMLTWKSTPDWITNGCDRCPFNPGRGALGHDEPCDRCPTWEMRISEFRKKHKFKYGIGQNPEVPF